MRKWLAALVAAISMGALDANAQLTKMTIATGVDPAFSQFYVAKEGGLFEKNGLDVTINTGPSGSAMVPFLVNNQVQAAYGSDLAGVINHQVDPNIVAQRLAANGGTGSIPIVHIARGTQVSNVEVRSK